MAIDLAKFAKAFYEEAQEHLSAMESLLVAADPGSDDESLNALFRAAHSVKGGAAAFGHVELTNFTHQLETLLDRIRKREAELTVALVTQLLWAVDMMRAHVAALDRGTTPDLQAMRDIESALARGAEAPAPPAEPAAPAPVEMLEDDPDDDFGFFAPLDEPRAEVQPARPEPAHPPQAGDAHAAGVDATSIRVNIAKIDTLVNLVGELVITESMLADASRDFGFDGEGRFAAALTLLQRNTRNLQEAILGVRMVPISFIFSRLPRLARDVGERLAKDVELELHGEETELDKGLVERITDPLIHLVRNAIDHGIEPAEVRAAAGKRPRGRVVARARHEGGMVVISVADDGAGLDRARILAKAAEHGIEADASWSDADVWRLVLRAGFSTSSVVTDVSGRGVGMDVVSRNVEALGGSLEIDSQKGRGTTMTIRLPLTLAILDAMPVSIAGETYVLPLANIEQSLQPREGQVSPVGGRDVLRIGDECLPVVGLDDIFPGTHEAAGARHLLVVLEAEGRRAALRVDDILGQHQVVLKSIEDNYRRVGGLTGATILGDGRVAFILDVAHLVGRAHGAGRKQGTAHGPARIA
jgi:two-component system chemotaxis sensor kinase CheA